MKLSDFTASQDLDLYIKDDKPCGSEKGAKQVLIKKGDKIPEVFITLILLNNQNFIGNLKYKNGIPQLTQEQEKKYDIKFTPPPPEEFKIKKHKWTQEKLTVKANKLGKKFKDWAEKEFGEEKIDRRHSVEKVITEILRIQEKEKRT